MKTYRSILSVIFLFAIAAGQFGCEQRPSQGEKHPVPQEIARQAPRIPAPETAKSLPAIEFEKTVYDFGKIDPGGKHNCQFKFKNTGNGPLEIKQPRSTCACAVAKLDKMEYDAGEAGTLTIEYHAPKTAGPKTQRVFVKSNDPKNPEVKLSIKAEVVLKVDVTPKTLNLSLKEPNAGCPKITVTATDGQPFSITGFNSPENCITADFYRDEKATKFVLEPKADLEKLAKTLRGSIKIRTSHPKVKQLTVNYSVLPYFETQPRNIIIQNAQTHKPQRRRIWVKSNYGQDFEIESVRGKKGAIKLLDQKKMGARFRLDVEIMPPERPAKVGYFRDTLYIQIQDGPKLKVNCNILYLRKTAKRPR